MINLLQVNIGMGNSAQDLMFSAAWRCNSDIIIVSEQYRTGDESNGWYRDATNRAAIVIVNGTIPEKTKQSDVGTGSELNRPEANEDAPDPQNDSS